MASSATRNLTPRPRSNVGSAESLISIVGGLGLAAAAARPGPMARRAGLGIAGASLLARGATGFCPMKAAMTGQATLGRGFAEQARRAGGLFRGGVGEIETLRDMRLAELQELYSAELQLQSLLPELAAAAHNVRLRQRLNDYAAEIGPRLGILEGQIRHFDADPTEHPDQAMQALVVEARKMMRVANADVRDAGLIASVQRLLHYRIAACGTVAAYARALGETYHAGALAGLSSRDKEVDEQLTELAEHIINPSAASGEGNGVGSMH
jgi:ferritin-like metal-binding protein YciE